jgi:hypothetical protein
MVCIRILSSWLSEHLHTRGLPPTSFGRKTPTKNNTDDPANKTVEANYEGRMYYFSTAQHPSQHTSVYGSSDIFALAMFQHSAPTLLAYVVHMPKMLTEKLKIYCHLHFLLVFEDPTWNKE